MIDLTKIANNLLDIASQLHHHRAQEAVNGAGWQAERNTLVGRIEVLEQSLAAAGVVDPNSTNPMAVALYAVVIFRFGNDSHKSTYLRARGWRLSIVNSFGMWHHDTHGAWNLGTAIDIQTSKDISPLRKMLSEPDPLPKAVEPPPIYFDESTMSQTSVALRTFAESANSAKIDINRPMDSIPASFLHTNEGKKMYFVRDTGTGEVLLTPNKPEEVVSAVMHHPV